MKTFESHNILPIILGSLCLVVLVSSVVFAQDAEIYFKSYTKLPNLKFTYYVNSTSLEFSSTLNCTLDAPCLDINQVFKKLYIDVSNSDSFVLSSASRIVAVEIILLEDLQSDCSSGATIAHSPITGMNYWIKFTSQPGKSRNIKCKGFGVDLMNVNRKDIEFLYFENVGIVQISIYSNYAKYFILSNVKVSLLVVKLESPNLFLLEYSNIQVLTLKTSSILKSIINNGTFSFFSLEQTKGVEYGELRISNSVSSGSFTIISEQLSLFTMFNSMFNNNLASFTLSNTKTIWVQDSFFSNSAKDDPTFFITSSGMIRFRNTRMVHGKVWFFIRTSEDVEWNNCEISLSSSMSKSIDNEFDISYNAPINVFSVSSLSIVNSTFIGNQGDKASTIYLSEVAIFNCLQSKFMQGVGSSIYFDSLPQKNTPVYRITGSLFQDNYSPNLGGAIYVNTKNLVISDTIFKNNIAELSGGALFIASIGALDTKGSQFIGNRVLYNTSQSTDKKYFGNGGAISIINFSAISALSFTNTNFESNLAFNGGALFYIKNIVKEVKACTFKNNRARNTGGAIYQYAQNSVLTSTNNQFIENVAFVYGNDYFSSENTLSLNRSNDAYLLYPGQQVFISAVATSLGVSIPVNVDTMYFKSDSSIFTFHLNTLSDGINITLLSVESSIRSYSPFNITLGWNRYSLNNQNSLTFQVVTCPTDTELVLTNVPAVGYSCTPIEKLPLELILGIAIPSSVVFFILGIISSVIVMLVVMKILARLKKLSRKEKAERSIAKKILDKGVIFGTSDQDSYYTKSLTSPLLSQNEMEMKMKSRLDAIIINIEDLEIVKKISEGGQGVVYKALLYKETNVAVKSLKNLDDDEELQLEFEKEASILASLNHANILKFYGVCITDDTRYMVTEFLENGSLERLIFNCRNGKINLSFQQKILLLQDVASGMEYLHSLEPAIIHRDLKPGNVLLDPELRCKICDFGLSRSVGNLNTQNTMTRNIGTLFYTCPEMMGNENSESDNSHETKLSKAMKIDTYSFGIIMWELFFELTPYTLSAKVGSNSCLAPVNILGMVMKGYRPQIPFETLEQVRNWLLIYPVGGISTSNCVAILEYFALAKECWNQEPLSRPSFHQVRSDLLKIMSTAKSCSY